MSVLHWLIEVCSTFILFGNPSETDPISFLTSINGLQVNGGGVFDRDFTKSLIIRDFYDALKNLLDMWIFSYYTHYYQKKFPTIAMQDL